MQREIQLTADGSHTLAVPAMQVSYHSKHGAIGESRHVFIDAGLKYLLQQGAYETLYMLEMGFGTGLNTLLTLNEAVTLQQKIHYQAIEKFPLLETEVNALNYGGLLNMQAEMKQIHTCGWEIPVQINPFFILQKYNSSLQHFTTNQPVNCIYFDAFSPTAQPELWSEEVFEQLYRLLIPGGILVTYCSKSVIRKNMVQAGFMVEKIPGPWGKREMVRARK